MGLLEQVGTAAPILAAVFTIFGALYSIYSWNVRRARRDQLLLERDMLQAYEAAFPLPDIRPPSSPRTWQPQEPTSGIQSVPVPPAQVPPGAKAPSESETLLAAKLDRIDGKLQDLERDGKNASRQGLAVAFVFYALGIITTIMLAKLHLG